MSVTSTGTLHRALLILKYATWHVYSSAICQLKSETDFDLIVFLGLKNAVPQRLIKQGI